MALRPKPGPMNFSDKAYNFYSSEYKKKEPGNILVDGQPQNAEGHKT